MLIHLPEDVKAILHTLQEAGYEAYAVGGCIRDSLLRPTSEGSDLYGESEGGPEAAGFHGECHGL